MDDQDLLKVQKPEIITKNCPIDPDVIKLLSILDTLFIHLPKEVIDEFSNTEEFELYKRVMEKYNIGN